MANARKSRLIVQPLSRIRPPSVGSFIFLTGDPPRLVGEMAVCSGHKGNDHERKQVGRRAGLTKAWPLANLVEPFARRNLPPKAAIMKLSELFLCLTIIASDLDRSWLCIRRFPPRSTASSSGSFSIISVFVHASFYPLPWP